MDSDSIEAVRQRQVYGIPWYAKPVAFLCGDASLNNWSWLTCLLLLLKFLSVATVTNPSVAFAVIISALTTTLAWFYLFVLVGSSSHRLLYAELPFNKVLQTFWAGACICPVGVYVVRAAGGAAIAFVPGVSALASPKDVMYGGSSSGGDQESGGGSGMTLAVAFVVSYVAAGLAEELAKYFALARYYPDESDTSRLPTPSSTSASVSGSGGGGSGGDGKGGAADVQDAAEAGGARDRDQGTGDEALGWYAPLANPRVAVYLAFVVGLGFSWTENIQYGAQVYRSAALWDGRNVTVQRNVTITSDWNLSFAASSGDGDGDAADFIDRGAGKEGGEGGRGFGDEMMREYDVDGDGANVDEQVWEVVEDEKSARDVLVAFFLAAPSLGASSAGGAAAAAAAAEMGFTSRSRRLQFPSRLGCYLRACRLSRDHRDRDRDRDGDSDALDAVDLPGEGTVSSIHSGLGSGRMGWVTGRRTVRRGGGGGGGDTMRRRENPVLSTSDRLKGQARSDRLSTSVLSTLSFQPLSFQPLSFQPLAGAKRPPRWPSSRMGSENGDAAIAENGGGLGGRRDKDPDGHADKPDDSVDSGFNVTVNATVNSPDISEATKHAAAVTVTLMRGMMPMHAVWAGLSATRYVRQLWLEVPPGMGRERGGGVDVIGCIGWSWFYHGTFDFSIMAIPALMISTGGASEFTVLALSCSAFAMVLLSWWHLARCTFSLERDLTAAGLPAPGKGAGLPRLGTCSGRDRRRCCCCCLPCAACFCADVAEWESGEEGDDGGGDSGGGVSYGSIG